MGLVVAVQESLHPVCCAYGDRRGVFKSTDLRTTWTALAPGHG